MSLPAVVSHAEWRAARVDLLAEEKALTRARDAVSTRRRELPMVEIDEEYAFEGPAGPARLLDLFEGRRQLIVGHFMFDPTWEDGCPSCSAGADEIAPGLLEHLHVRDTTLAFVSRAPLAKIEAYKARRGWSFPWWSSHGSTFNHDFGVTVDAADKTAEYNFRAASWPEPGAFEMPGTSCFLRDGERVFYTYSSYARGAEWTGGSYAFLDLTPLGRQEKWEEPRGRADDARAARPDFAS